MADAILLSQDTYDRILKMLEKWEKGDIITPGKDLLNEEVGTGYQKLGVDVNELSNSIGGCLPTAPPDQTNTYVWGVVAGTCDWINTTNCA